MANKIIAYACKSACMTYFGNGNFREFFGIERGGGIFKLKFQNGNSRIPMALIGSGLLTYNSHMARL